MKNTNYYTVHGWMINELGLSGNDLLIYAIIYGFSQDGSTEFSGSLNYLVTFINSTKPTVINCLKKLCERGLLVKTDRIINNQNFPTYTAVVPDLTSGKNSLPPLKNSLLGDSKNSLPPSKESLPNNTSIINSNNQTNSSGETPAEQSPAVSFLSKSFKKWNKEEFSASIKAAREKRKAEPQKPNFTTEMLTAFFAYWSEPDAAGKMRFQKQDTWATANRLVTWEQRDKN
jgi:hypothetical protein